MWTSLIIIYNYSSLLALDENSVPGTWDSKPLRTVLVPHFMENPSTCLWHVFTSEWWIIWGDGLTHWWASRNHTWPRRLKSHHTSQEMWGHTESWLGSSQFKSSAYIITFSRTVERFWSDSVWGTLTLLWPSEGDLMRCAWSSSRMRPISISWLWPMDSHIMQTQ